MNATETVPPEQDLALLLDLSASTTLAPEQRQHIDKMLDVARLQCHQEEVLADKRTSGFMLLFMFLYTVLGASLTLPALPTVLAHASLHYAIEAIPVLISFSGFYLSVLLLVSTRRAMRRNQSWQQTIDQLESSTGQRLTLWFEQLNRGPKNYSHSGMRTALSFFVCITWVVLYNYFTFTTSGVIGSVISLFISTMVYVMLDIQLLKTSLIPTTEKE